MFFFFWFLTGFSAVCFACARHKLCSVLWFIFVQDQAQAQHELSTVLFFDFGTTRVQCCALYLYQF